MRLAFELAQGRRGRLTSVDKANVLATSRLWRKVVDELRPEFPNVMVEHRLVDSAAMLLIQHPAAFDVVVTENLFGDILSDEASVLAGSLGMLPSASIGERAPPTACSASTSRSTARRPTSPARTRPTPSAPSCPAR